MKNLFLLLLLFSASVISAGEVKKDTIKKYEREFGKLVKNENLPNKNIYYIYLIAARDFQLENLNDYYLKYLIKAKNVKTNEDKSEVYWRLIDHYRRTGDVPKAKDLYLEWDSLKLDTSEVMKQAFLLVKSFVYNEKLSVNNLKKLEEGPFSYQAKQENLDQLIKSKEYAKALSQINQKNLEDEMISTIIRYDLLSNLVLGRKTKALICAETYNKYPNSQSYSMKLCKSLMEYSESGKISKKSLEQTEKIFTNKIYKNDKFLYTALLDLK